MIKILVDSASDIKKSDAIYDIFVPITINIDGREYADGVDMDTASFYTLLMSTKDFPCTSQPSPQTFVSIFEEVKCHGDELIYLALSSGLSGTYQGAVMAREIVGYDKIYIVDTKAATHIVGMLARLAVKMRADGACATEIVSACEALRSKIHLFVGVDTLEYLHRGGRLSNASAVVGTLAHIKPLIALTDDGRLEAVGKALGLAKAIKFISDKLGEYEIDKSFPILSIYSHGTENCEALEKRLAADGNPVSERLQLGSAIGTHAGPGVYGVIFVTK